MKLGVAIIWTVSKEACCHSNLPRGIQIFWSLITICLLILYIKSPHFFLWGILGQHIDRYINAVADSLVSYCFY